MSRHSGVAHKKLLSSKCNRKIKYFNEIREHESNSSDIPLELILLGCGGFAFFFFFFKCSVLQQACRLTNY